MWALSIVFSLQLDMTSVACETGPVQKIFTSRNDLEEWICSHFDTGLSTNAREKGDVRGVILNLSENELKLLLNELNQTTDQERSLVLKRMLTQMLARPQGKIQPRTVLRDSQEKRSAAKPVLDVDVSLSKQVSLDQKKLLVLAGKVFPGFSSRDEASQSELLENLTDLCRLYGESRVEEASLYLQCKQEYLQGSPTLQADRLRAEVESHP